MPSSCRSCTRKGADILRALAAVVEYQEDLGVADYPLPTVASPAALAQRVAPQAASIVRSTPKREGGGNIFLPPDDELKKIAADISACALDHPESRQCFPGQGPEDADLFLVLGEDVPMTGTGTHPLLSADEEELLTRMLAAIDFSFERVFVTGVVKCHGHAAACDSALCLPFLRRQLARVPARAVCVMGSMAARLLTGKNLPVSRLRNRFLPCSLLPGRDIPMLVTYHPRFLLKNPDMKRASWDDLRLLKLKIDRKRDAVDAPRRR